MNDSEDFKSYPNMDAWIRNRQFCDSDEVYTNGAELITVNDVLKGWNYYMNLTEERARAEAIKEFKEFLQALAFGKRKGLVHWSDVENITKMMKEQKT